MNTIPLVKGNTQEEINTSIIALKKALSELEAQDRLLQGTDKDVQDKIKQINELIEGINTHLGTVDTHLTTIDGQITDLQPVNSVTSGNMHSVTSGAVYDAINNVVQNSLIMKSINLGTITIGADNLYSITLSNYGIDTHNKPWSAFVWNRSGFYNFNLFGDGYNTLYIFNNTNASITGQLHVAIIYQG